LIKCSALLYLLGCLNDAELDFGKRIHRYLATYTPPDTINLTPEKNSRVHSRQEWTINLCFISQIEQLLVRNHCYRIVN